MNLSVSRPGHMTASPNHMAGDRTLVYADADGMDRALTLWINPATAAQWIEALTPIADGGGA